MKYCWFIIIFSVVGYGIDCEKIIPQGKQSFKVLELGRYKANYKLPLGKKRNIQGILCAAYRDSYTDFSNSNSKFYYQDTYNKKTEEFTLNEMMSKDGIIILDKYDMLPFFRPFIVDAPIVKFKINSLSSYGPEKAILKAEFDFAVNLSNVFSRFKRSSLPFEAEIDLKNNLIKKESLYSGHKDVFFKNLEFFIKGTKINSLLLIDGNNSTKVKF